jgi:hypothetical protein
MASRSSSGVTCSGTAWPATRRTRVCSSSPWIRGAPHRKFSRLIRTIRSRTSQPILGRPPRHWAWAPNPQSGHKPRRRQRKTVAGWTITRPRCQFAHHRDNKTQNSRSPERKRGTTRAGPPQHC